MRMNRPLFTGETAAAQQGGFGLTQPVAPPPTQPPPPPPVEPITDQVQPDTYVNLPPVQHDSAVEQPTQVVYVPSPAGQESPPAAPPARTLLGIPWWMWLGGLAYLLWSRRDA